MSTRLVSKRGLPTGSPSPAEAAKPNIDAQFLIGGQALPAESGQRFLVSNPATGVAIGSAPDGAGADIERAVDAAKHGLSAWQGTSSAERVDILRSGLDAIEEEFDYLTMLDSAGSGNPVQAMRNDLTKALRTAKYLCSLATETPGLVLRSDGNLLDYTVRVPFGIVGRIIPFNHPLMFSLEKILPPLLVGNAVILKPSPYGCLAPLELGRVLSPHIPPGILNVVTDVHGQAGQALVAHPDIKRIAFTGSVETARRIVADSAATGPKQYSFELGGKNPLIVYPDVSAQDAADVATAGMNLKSTLGQSCGSTSRAFVHRDIYEDFLLEVRERFESLKPGLPTELDTEIGCLASQEQFNRVMSYIQQGLDEGARLITGGKRVADAELVNGHYMAPAIFADVDQSMSVAQEEIFGPVLCVLPWDEEAQMIKDVNSVAYGLTANIWTFDPSVADRLVKAIEAGYIFVRAQSLKHILGAPFGGVKQSGVGREGSLDEILSYTEVKNVAMYS